MDDDIHIRQYQPKDRQAVRTICCDSADLGRPIEGFFPDRETAADFLMNYYTDFEPQSSFVAEQDSKVVGYVTGCFDNRRYGLTMFWIIIPCVLWKGIIRGTVFKKEFRDLLAGMVQNWQRIFAWRKESFHSHEGHLHIGLSLSSRGHGIGIKLVQTLLASANGKGLVRITASVHSANISAIAFFERLGFYPEHSRPMIMVRGGQSKPYQSLFFVKNVS